MCRRNLPGDVGVIMRIHGFLENWGLINFPAREHRKGFVEKKSDMIACHVCETNKEKVYFHTKIDSETFQICSKCY